MRFILLFIGLLSLAHNNATASAGAADDSLKNIKKATCMVAVATDMGPALSTGTLVGVHTGADGSKRGLVLTATHSFFDQSPYGGMSLTASYYQGVGFGNSLKGMIRELLPGARTDSWNQVARIFYEPLVEYGGQFNNDICLAEIILPNDFAIEPAALYDGAGYTTRPNLPAKLFGFGQVYGPRATRTIPPDFKKRESSFYVTHYSAASDYRRSACFRSHAFGTHTEAEVIAAGSFADGFEAGSLEFVQLATDLSASKTVYIHADADTKLPADGCSGAALIFKTSRGHQVSGVYSQSSLESFHRTFERPVHASKFESVPDHAWLYEAVRQFTEAGIIEVPEGVMVQEF